MTEPTPAAREYSREELDEIALMLSASASKAYRTAADAFRQLLTERDRLTAALVTLADGYKLKAPLPSPEIQDAIRVARAAGAGGEKTDGA